MQIYFPSSLHKDVDSERVLTQRDEVGAGLEKGRRQQLELKHKAQV